MRKKDISLILLVLAIVLFFSSCLKEKRISINNIKQRHIINTAINQIGKKYCFGGKGSSCFDCSGFVYYVYKKNGYDIPSSTERIKKIGKKIKKIRDLKVADIMIFKIKKKLYHTGIYIGDNKFVHSPKGGKRVRIDVINGYWRKKFKYARRIL